MHCTQQGFGKMGAEVLNWAFVILLYICAKLNICTSNSPTSPSPRPLVETVWIKRRKYLQKKYIQIMTTEQYNELIKQLGQVLDNQVILGNKLNTIQSNIHVIINNQKILGKD